MKTNNFYRSLAGKLTALFGALLLLAPSAQATHIVGGEITYQWISGNQYRLSLALYRDCQGVGMPSSAAIEYSSVSNGTNATITLNQVGATVLVTPMCALSLPNSSCNGGTLYGVQKAVFEGVVTLPAAANDWIFSYSDCCRNMAPINVIDPNLASSYFEAKLDNLTVPFNNSVQFAAPPVNIINANMTTQMNWSAWDVDMDSLSFQLVAARSDATTSLVNNPGFTPQQPFMPILPTQLDASTGILSATPNGQQVNIICMRVSEYRNGVKISEIYRDLQVNVMNTSNLQPTLTGMNGGTLFTTAACPGDSIQFNVSATDPDAGQLLSIVMEQSPAAAATFSSSGQPPVGSFLWVPTAADINSQPYVFVMRVNDDHCDYNGTNAYAYKVYVNGCATNDVWPGDANSDGNANLFDLLAVGMAFNDNGPARPSASLNWVAQPCPDWTNTFPNTINHKHADCDGNGTVGFPDTTAIFQNYGLNHPLRIMPPQPMVGIPDLIVTASSDTVGTSALVHFDVSLGNSLAPADSIYGIAFRLYYDPALIDTNSVSVTYAGSMFGVNGTDMVTINRNFAAPGYVDIALSRLNQTNISGTGNLARVTIVTTDNVSGKVTLFATPADIEAISASGASIPVDPIGDSVIIDPFITGLSNPSALSFAVHPIPAGEILNLRFGQVIPDQVVLTDLAGREVARLIPASQHETIDISGISSGAYLLKATSGNDVVTQKILVY